MLVIVQGQGKADLATGYELDIIASAVVGGASLAGGRGSVIGAVLGTLIFGVLRNALPQIPGATFYDRLIVGLVVIVIVVMDQLLLRRIPQVDVESARDDRIQMTRAIAACLLCARSASSAAAAVSAASARTTPARRRSCASP